MKVLKFGGTSVASPESLKHVINIVKNSNERKIIIVSALAGVTNQLIEMAKLASEGNQRFNILVIFTCERLFIMR